MFCFLSYMFLLLSPRNAAVPPGLLTSVCVEVVLVHLSFWAHTLSLHYEPPPC